MTSLTRLVSCVALMTAGNLAWCAPENPPIAQPDVQQAQKAMADLGQRLRTALQEKIAAEGAVAAVDFCAEQAPAIAQAVSLEHGVKVGRSAVRVRNPANAPSDWQQTTLAEFATQAATGADVTTLSHQERDGNTLRLAKGLRVEPPCLICHGSSADIAPEVLAKINQRYPEDQAFGFKSGDLRGLIWAEVTASSN